MSGDADTNPDHSLRTITDKASHDVLIAQCNKHNIPTILHVYNSSVPRCQSFLSVFEDFARSNPSQDEVRIQYAKMDYTPETSFMFKFAPNQLPITVLMVGQGWARTVMGADLAGIERLVAQMMGERGKLVGA